MNEQRLLRGECSVSLHLIAKRASAPRLKGTRKPDAGPKNGPLITGRHLEMSRRLTNLILFLPLIRRWIRRCFSTFFFHVAPIRLPILDVLTLRCHRVFFFAAANFNFIFLCWACLGVVSRRFT